MATNRFAHVIDATDDDIFLCPWEQGVVDLSTLRIQDCLAAAFDALRAGISPFDDDFVEGGGIDADLLSIAEIIERRSTVASSDLDDEPDLGDDFDEVLSDTPPSFSRNEAVLSSINLDELDEDENGDSDSLPNKIGSRRVASRRHLGLSERLPPSCAWKDQRCYGRQYLRHPRRIAAPA